MRRLNAARQGHFPNREGMTPLAVTVSPNGDGKSWHLTPLLAERPALQQYVEMPLTPGMTARQILRTLAACPSAGLEKFGDPSQVRLQATRDLAVLTGERGQRVSEAGRIHVEDGPGPRPPRSRPCAARGRCPPSGGPAAGR